VITDPDRCLPYCTDWTRRWVGTTPAVVRPGSAAEIVDVLAACREHNGGVVPQGGNTGLVGGSVPHDGEVIISTSRLAQLDVVDRAAMTVVAQAGVPLARVQDAARASGLAFGVDLGARDTATIGGMAATNAGGLHVVRHGTMRTQVLGIEAVLGDGTFVQHLAGLRKDNTGYDLAGLLCGSEGTLGVITATTLRLVAAPDEVVTALVGFDSVDAAVAAATTLVALDSLSALELALGDGLALVATLLGLDLPDAGHAAAAVLVEVAASHDPTPELAAAVDTLTGRVAEPAVARTDRDRARLWRLREGHPEAAATLGIVHKLDVTVALDAIGELVARVRSAIADAAPGATTLLYGHLGDGNMHVNVVAPELDASAVEDAVLEIVVDLGGSISAEHGIGVAKRRWLARARSEGDIVAFRSIKRALDPAGIMNPNVLLP
jgi:FAD/FMN-containing dehydrogenase